MNLISNSSVLSVAFSMWSVASWRGVIRLRLPAIINLIKLQDQFGIETISPEYFSDCHFGSPLVFFVIFSFIFNDEISNTFIYLCHRLFMYSFILPFIYPTRLYFICYLFTCLSIHYLFNNFYSSIFWSFRALEVRLCKDNILSVTWINDGN